MVDCKIIFITRGEMCSELKGTRKVSWFKRILGKGSNEHLIASSEQIIDTEIHEVPVMKQLKDIQQVVTSYDAVNIETAHDFFPHIHAAQIMFRNKTTFLKKIYDLAIHDVIVVVLSPTELFDFTGITDKSYFAIHEIEYKYTSDNTLEMIKEESIISHGTASKYDVDGDTVECTKNIMKSFETIGKHCCWLDKIRDDVLLKNLRVPQVHDAATAYINPSDKNTWKLNVTGLGSVANRISTVAYWSKNQDLSPSLAFLAGARSFDIRVYVKKNGDAIFNHGAILINMDFLDVISSLKALLVTHPSEFIYVLLKFSGEISHYKKVFDNFIEIMKDECVVIGDPNIDGNKTVKEIRGKCIVYSSIEKFNPQGDITSYYEGYADAKCAGTRNFISPDWETLEKHYLQCYPLHTDSERLFVFQLHPQVNISSIRKKKGSGAIKSESRKFNAKAAAWLKNIKSERLLNIVEIDYFSSVLMDIFLNNLNKHNMK